MNRNRIVSFPADAVPKGSTDWDRVRAMTEEEIDRGAATDPDNPPLSDDELARAQLVRPEDRRAHN